MKFNSQLKVVCAVLRAVFVSPPPPAQKQGRPKAAAESITSPPESTFSRDRPHVTMVPYG